MAPIPVFFAEFALFLRFFSKKMVFFVILWYNIAEAFPKTEVLENAQLFMLLPKRLGNVRLYLRIS